MRVSGLIGCITGDMRDEIERFILDLCIRLPLIPIRSHPVRARSQFQHLGQAIFFYLT